MDLSLVSGAWRPEVEEARRGSAASGARTSGAPPAPTRRPARGILLRGRRRCSRAIPARGAAPAGASRGAAGRASLRFQLPFEPVGHRAERVVSVAHRGDAVGAERVELAPPAAALGGRCAFPRSEEALALEAIE